MTLLIALLLSMFPAVDAPSGPLTVIADNSTGQEIRRGPGTVRNDGTIQVDYAVIRGATRARILFPDGTVHKTTELAAYDVAGDALLAPYHTQSTITFATMLAQTLQRRAVIVGVHQVSPISTKMVTFQVPEDAALIGTLSIHGGTGDISLRLRGGNPPVDVWNPGIVSGLVRVRQSLPAGRYELLLDNQRSLLTPKLVQATLYAVWYR